MAGEVGKGRASIGGQSGDEAVQLEESIRKEDLMLIEGEQDMHTEQAGTLGSWALARPAATRAMRAWENCIFADEAVM